MKNKLLILAVCAVALSGLAAAYLSLGEAEEPGAGEAAAEQPYYTLLDTVEESGIESFSLAAGGETLNFLPDAGSATGWRLDRDARFQLDTYYMRSLLRGITELGTEQRLLESAGEDELAAFGLNPPQAVARVKYAGGGGAALLLGNMTADGENYYIMREGDPAVYTVDMYAGEKYAFTIDDLTDRMMPEIDTGQLSYAFIGNSGHEIEIMPEEDGGPLKMAKPYKGREIYLSDFTADVLGDLHEIQFDRLIETGTQNLQSYGLDAPWLDVRVRDHQNDFRLLVGNGESPGRFYAKRGGDGMIFTIDAGLIERFQNADVFEFMDRFAALVDIKTVDSVVVESGDVRTVAEPYGGEKGLEEGAPPAGEAAEAAGGAEAPAAEGGQAVEGGQAGAEREMKPTVDGKAVDAQAFRDWYQSLIGLSYDSALDAFDPAGEPPSFAVEFHLAGGETRGYLYYDYNDGFYAVEDGGEWFAVSKMSVNTAERLMEGLKG